MSAIEISGLFLHPLKSGAAVPMTEIELDDRGVVGDRRWMVVDPLGGFVTQRTVPRLALVRGAAIGEGLALEAHGMRPIRISHPDERSPLEVSIWNDVMTAFAGTADADQWISEFLGAPLRIVGIGAVSRRPRSKGGELVAFADEYPLLLTAEESLHDLNARMTEPVPMNRFRPNIVVRGGAPYAEDGWRHVVIGGLPFDLGQQCPRCPITQVDQQTGMRGVEPLPTLSRYRRTAGGVVFGVNLSHRGKGTIRVGDKVEIID